MFTRLLTAIDLSPCSEMVFAQGLELAQKTGASLILLHVSSLDEPESPAMPMLAQNYYVSGGTEAVMGVYDEQWRTYEEKGLEMLQSFAERAAQVSVTAEFSQNFGSPGKMICQMADSLNADLIMMGRRGNSSLNEFIMGSVSNYVLHHTSRSVFVVQCHAADRALQD
jgi:nucleotide-binding universal stress UspA family protein